MKNVARPAFLTPEEMERVQTLWRELKDTGRFAAEVEREIIEPNIARINAAFGQEEGAKYLAHAVELVFGEAERTTPGYLWEWAEDVCQVCGASIGHRLRFMHLGLCDPCANAPTH